MAKETSRRSWEFAAIPITLVLLGLLAIILWAADAGPWAWLVVGAVGLIAVVAVALVGMRRPHHPSTPWRADGSAPRVDDGVHRVLVIADDACAAADLGAALVEGGGGRRTSVFVIAPALGSRTARWTGDEHAYQDAQTHLDATLAALADLNCEADGRVGPHDPLQAADDGLRSFPADEIVFAVHAAGAANWLEDGVVDAARSRYPISVRELVVAPPES